MKEYNSIIVITLEFKMVYMTPAERPEFRSKYPSGASPIASTALIHNHWLAREGPSDWDFTWRTC